MAKPENRGAGLSRARIELVNRYLADAHGPPPRAPLRFWIGGEWVVMASPEPETGPGEAVAIPEDVRGPLPPAYDWISEYRNTALKPAIRGRLLPLLPAAGKRRFARRTRSAGKDGTAQMAAKLRAFGQGDDQNAVRDKIAGLREQRDAGEISHTDFAMRVAELLNGAIAPPIASEGNPSSA